MIVYFIGGTAKQIQTVLIALEKDFGSAKLKVLIIKNI